MIVRKNHVIFKTEDQCHGFNFPYQLVVEKALLYNEDYHYVNSGEYQLEQGDVVIMGSDGVFDNLHDEEIVGIINNNDGKSAEVIAENIKQKALESSNDNNKITPFTYKMRDFKGSNKGYEGGKRDDISVIVAIVK